MAVKSPALHVEAATSSPGRWSQLVVGVLCMVMIANLQYGWTLFVNPINQKYHWGTAAIQLAFSVFIATETWLVPIEGWFVDRFGPRVVVALGGDLRCLRLGSELSRRFAVGIVCGRGLIRHWCGCGVRDLRRQRAQVVSRSARPRCRLDRSRLRRRYGRDRHPDPRDDTRIRLPIRVSLVRPRARSHYSAAVAITACAATG